MSKVLVTGGSGFIGSALVRHLVKLGYDVRAFDIVESRAKGAENYMGSILDTDALRLAIRGCEYVVHLAAMVGVRRTEIRRLDCLNINILGTVNVLENCVKERVKKILFISSSEVYGDQAKQPISETNPVNPKSVYGVTKLAGEEYVRAYRQAYALDHTIVRLFNIYGTGQIAEFVIPRFVKAIQQGLSPCIYGTGEQVRAFCYVDDAVEGIALALFATKADGEVFNIGDDKKPITMKDLATTVIGIGGKRIKPEFVPLQNADREACREIVTRTPDISKAKRFLGYKCTVSLKDGIEKVLKSKIKEAWFNPFTQTPL